MNTTEAPFKNPFRPGAGHQPPHLAGRQREQDDFDKLLEQDTILENVVLTGLRGVGKTVLLDTFKPLAIKKGWLWVGADLSESSSVSEENLATRLLTDLSVVTSSLILETRDRAAIGFAGIPKQDNLLMSYPVLRYIYENTPGLVMDKLKRVLETVWDRLSKEEDKRGLIFAYDEAQNLADHKDRTQFPLALLLDVFQSIQKQNIPFMLVLTGLPTLFPKLVEARTYAERMFTVVFVDSLTEQESHEAILRPIEKENCPVTFSEPSVDVICGASGGYPYFIQFICREVFDLFIQQMALGQEVSVPIHGIVRKLDTDFFAGRWARVTDRQHDLLHVIATIPDAGDEFTVSEIVAHSKTLLPKSFSGSHINQMLNALIDLGLIYKNRHGKYSFAIPLFADFIRRQMEPEQLAMDLAGGN